MAAYTRRVLAYMEAGLPRGPDEHRKDMDAVVSTGTTDLKAALSVTHALVDTPSTSTNDAALQQLLAERLAQATCGDAPVYRLVFSIQPDTTMHRLVLDALCQWTYRHVLPTPSLLYDVTCDEVGVGTAGMASSVNDRQQALLDTMQSSKKAVDHMMTCVSPAVCEKVRASLAILRECFSRYESHEIAFSFNGGKDCTLLLHLLLAIMYELYCSHDTASSSRHRLTKMRTLYVASEKPFPQVG